MSERTIQIRAIIEAGTVSEGRVILRRMIRYATRKTIYEYQRDRYVFDFSDTMLVPKRHRDFLSTIRSTAQTDLDAVQAATTISELLSILDRIFG